MTIATWNNAGDTIGKPNLATISRGAKIVAASCQTAHDLWDRGQFDDAAYLINAIADDCQTLSRQACELLAQATAVMMSRPNNERRGTTS